MPDQLHRLIYCSRNAIRGDSAEVEQRIRDLLVSARRHNHANGTTGALLFTHGCFVQALEGPRDTLEEIFERILCSEIHCDVTVLAFEPIEERAFPDWDMAYLGEIESGTSASIAAMALNDVFERRMTDGEPILSLMRGVIEREWAWAGAPG